MLVHCPVLCDGISFCVSVNNVASFLHQFEPSAEPVRGLSYKQQESDAAPPLSFATPPPPPPPPAPRPAVTFITQDDAVIKEKNAPQLDLTVRVKVSVFCEWSHHCCQKYFGNLLLSGRYPHCWCSCVALLFMHAPLEVWCAVFYVWSFLLV